MLLPDIKGDENFQFATQYKTQERTPQEGNDDSILSNRPAEENPPYPNFQGIITDKDRADRKARLNHSKVKIAGYFVDVNYP